MDSAPRIRSHKIAGRWVDTLDRVPVTPRAALPMTMLVTANAPLDALVTWADRHGWYTRSFPDTAHPPVAMAGTIAPACGGDAVPVRVTPVAIATVTLRMGMLAYRGTYRIDLLAPSSGADRPGPQAIGPSAGRYRTARCGRAFLRSIQVG